MIFYDFFYVFVFIYIKISKNLSAKYYQENKERLQKKLLKDIKMFLKKKKKKSDNMVVNVTKISQMMKKSLFEYRKKRYRIRKKMLFYNYKKLF